MFDRLMSYMHFDICFQLMMGFFWTKPHCKLKKVYTKKVFQHNRKSSYIRIDVVYSFLKLFFFLVGMSKKNYNQKMNYMVRILFCFYCFSALLKYIDKIIYNFKCDNLIYMCFVKWSPVRLMNMSITSLL